MPGAAGGPGSARLAMPGEELPPGEGVEGLLEEAPRRPSIRDQVLALAQQDPERALAVLRSWIREAQA
jgi:flagellar biosynthesis/type III secretory pathway M-ring protein FliF/YscJ